MDGKKFIAGIDEDAFKEFNITRIEGNEGQINIPREVKKEIPTIQNENIPQINIKIDNIPVVNTIPAQVIQPIKNKTVEERELEKFNMELKFWFESGETLKGHVKIRDFIINFIKDSIDWELEEVPSFLVKNIMTKNNLSIENQLAEIKKGSIIIEKNKENYYFMLAIIKYNLVGSKKWSYEDAHDDIAVCSSWIELKKAEIIEYILDSENKIYDSYLYNLLVEKHIKVLVGNVTKCKNLKEIYLELMRELPSINKNSLKEIIGNSMYLQSYSNALDENKYKDNFETLVNYFNCILGDTGKGIFIDSKEILEKIEYLIDRNWNIADITEEDFNELREIEQKPYEFYKDISNEKFYQELKKHIKYVTEEGNKIAYINKGENIGILNELFEVLRNHNISYNQKLYSDFRSNFITDKKYIENLKYGSMISGVSLDKAILILRGGISSYIEIYSNILNSIDREMERLEGQYSKQNSEIDSIIMENDSNAKESKKLLENICTNL